jgi:N-glycosylase/DNA lyase
MEKIRKIIEEVYWIQKTPIRKKIEGRLKEFEKLGKRGNDEWFCEMCFCLLTANSKAKTALEIQKELGEVGFLCMKREKLCDCIKRNKHRFHNNKAGFIVEARKFKKIKEILKKEQDPREWLVENVKGLGWKESSHFLRNVGYTDYAIIDRHIINLLIDNGLLKEKPKMINKKLYIELEKLLLKIADKLSMSQAELDLYMWYMKTGEVLK